MKEIDLLKTLYGLFNARAMEAVLAMLDENVSWANGMEGGHVHGRDGVRDYWTRQWAMIDPHVEPKGFSPGESGEVVVDVRQVVRDLNGNLLHDKMVRHRFRIEEGKVQRFEILDEPR